MSSYERITLQNVPGPRRLLYASLVLLFPVVLLVLVEGVLRIAGYGETPAFFVTQKIGDREFIRLNDAIARRYFPNLEIAPAASTDMFPPVKGAGVKRIFFLGASSMLGYPYMNNASMSSIVRDALREDVPETIWEVVNVSMTAVTSHFVREYGEACLEHEPDLIVVYAGHNEYYGGMGVASTASVGPAWMTGIYLRIQQFRVVQALTGLLHALISIVPQEQEVSGTLMEALASERAIPHGSRMFNAGVDVFRDNVSAVVESAREHGVPVLLTTVVSNLRDLPPFQSIHGEHVSVVNRREVERLLGAYDSTSDAGDAASRSGLSRAYALDTAFARTLFLLGQSAQDQDDHESAYVWYQRARDFDGLRFRASSALNETIREFTDAGGVTVVDVDTEIRGYAQAGVPGNDLLHEHVHGTVQGYETIASILYPYILRSLGVPKGQVRENRLLRALVTPIDTVAAAMRLDILLNSWPFTNDRRSLSDIHPSGWEQELAFGYLDGVYTWEEIHVRAAEQYEAAGRLDLAVAEYKALRASTPYNVSPYLRLGSLYLSLREADRARDILESSLRIESTSTARIMLGQIAYEQGRFDDAVQHLRQALALGQIDSDTGKDVRLSLAVALHRSGRTPEALDEVRRLRSLYPNFTPAEEFEAYVMR